MKPLIARLTAIGLYAVLAITVIAGLALFAWGFYLFWWKLAWPLWVKIVIAVASFITGIIALITKK